MKILPTKIADALLIEPQAFWDARGSFMETFRADIFAEAGIRVPFVQENHSASKKGVLRGMHFQIRQSQGKLVRVVAGEIYDVIVDLRRSSLTFGQWDAQVISAKNRLQLWIPEGFAHGFFTLSKQAEVIYKTTNYYAPEWERTILWNDPILGIEWPLINAQPPTISEKDSHGKRWSETDFFD